MRNLEDLKADYELSLVQAIDTYESGHNIHYLDQHHHNQVTFYVICSNETILLLFSTESSALQAFEKIKA